MSVVYTRVFACAGVCVCDYVFVCVLVVLCVLFAWAPVCLTVQLLHPFNDQL